ncbi:MAG: SpoIIE family protein phosphatase [Bacteroidales bacterium]|nr:SpoIIE family protein phosphatase [Bacteroidales bacterium]
MKKWLNLLRTSLSARLSWLTVIFAAVLFLGALSFLFKQSQDTIFKEAFSRATQVLDNTAQRVEVILDKVEMSTKNVAWVVQRHLESDDSMFVYSRSVVDQLPFLSGCSISFEPYHYPNRGRYFSIYSHREDDGDILTAQEGDDLYQYFYMDWYLQAKLLDQPTWIEPFMDYSPNDAYSPGIISSYSWPIYDHNKKFCGVVSNDISLQWLSNTISEMKPYPHSYSIMVGQGGTYFVHPDTTKLFYQTIFTETLEKPNPAITELGHAMQNGEHGMRELRIDGKKCFVFFRPLSTTGWSTAIICPKDDIFGGYYRLVRTILSLVIISLILMLWIFRSLIAKELNPLHTLADQAETIASGRFDVELPETNRVDEIGQLTEAFGNMQHSLVNYIDELTRTTANKERIEGELRIARDIQMSMVPRIFPPFPNRSDIDLYASMTPAKEVGGDLYDFFIQNEKLYFCVGDVSGKGVPASLFMAVTRNLFRVEAQLGLSPEKIATQLNIALSRDNDQNMFVTMFLGVIDLATGLMHFCNCGHNPPLLDGAFLPIEHNNMPLGVWEEATFEGASLENVKDRLLLIYTDGLNEAENPEHEQFSDERLLALSETLLDKSAEDVVEAIKEAVEKHRNGAEPNDDLTLLCLRVK